MKNQKFSLGLILSINLSESTLIADCSCILKIQNLTPNKLHIVKEEIT